MNNGALVALSTNRSPRECARKRVRQAQTPCRAPLIGQAGTGRDSVHPSHIVRSAPEPLSAH
ncbi:MAG: hypothetical protein ACI4L8_11255, partial [Candidatus Fimadaptatus sp.]